MSHFRNHPEIFNQIIRLTDEDSHTVIKEFYQNYKLCEIRQHLWDLVEIALTSDNTVFDDGFERSKLLWFYKQLEEMIEAIYLINIKDNNRMVPGN